MDIINKILDEAGLSVTDKLSKRSKYTYTEILLPLATYSSIKEAANALNIAEAALESVIRRNVRKLFENKPYKVKWNNYLLSLSNHKHCIGCNSILGIKEFVINKESWDNLSNHCRACKAIDRAIFTKNNPDYAKEDYKNNKSEYIARAIQYKTKRSLATVSWADISKIKEIYTKCPEGYHVDHIIPLQGELVCGLHVENNLQYLLAEDNIKKSNKFTGE